MLLIRWWLNIIPRIFANRLATVEFLVTVFTSVGAGTCPAPAPAPGEFRSKAWPLGLAVRTHLRYRKSSERGLDQVLHLYKTCKHLP